jgi:hypothetical protein
MLEGADARVDLEADLVAELDRYRPVARREEAGLGIDRDESPPFERRLRRRNPRGGGSEGGRSPPPSLLARIIHEQ